jgi:hypothetical protein
MILNRTFIWFAEEYLAKLIKEKKECPTGTEPAKSAAEQRVNPVQASTSQPQSLASSTSQQSVTSSSVQLPPITTDQTSLMMNLYNTFFNQYMQQYQQQKPPEPPAHGSTDEQTYEYLTTQAAFYAKQHQTIQTQLETCLSSTAQQFMNELANVKTPVVTNMPTTNPNLIQQNMYYTPYSTK